MSRRKLFLVFLPAMLVLLLAALMAWLLRTESGAGFLWQQVSRVSEGGLKAQSLGGNLTSGLQVEGFEFTNSSTLVFSPAISLSLNFDLFPPAVHIPELHSQELRIQLLDQPDKTAESSLTNILASLKLPLPLRLAAVKLDSFQVLDTDGAEMLSVKDLSLQADWHRTLDIRQLKAHSLDTEWEAGIQLDLESPFVLQGRVDAVSLLNLADGQPLSLAWQAEFSGDLSSLNTQLQITQPGVRIEGKLLDLLTTPGWELQLQSPELDWPLTASQGRADAAPPEISLRDVQASSQGAWPDYKVQLTAQLSGEEIPDANIDLSGRGDGASLLFDRLRLSGPELAFSGTGNAEWQQAWSVTTQGRMEYLHPARWMSDWPQEHPLAGDLNLNLTGEQIEITNLALEISGRDTRLQGHGLYPFSDGQVQAELSWQSLAWPLTGGGDTAVGAGVFSRSGQLSLAGRVDEWNAQGELLLRSADFPEGRMQLNAAGNGKAAKLVIGEGDVLGGQFTGTVDYQWAAPTSWSAQITARQISTTPLLPDFPAVLSGAVWARGERDNSRLQFDLRDVKGQIRGRQITASGKFSMQDKVIEANNLQLRSGTAHLQLDGGAGPGQQLRFSASVPEFSELWPGASGRLQADGKLSLDAKAPLLDLSLTADELQWGENRIASIRTENGSDGQRIIKIGKATFAGREWSKAQLTLASQPALEYLHLQGQLDKTMIAVSLRGSLKADRQGQISGWAGQLEKLQLDQEGLGYLNLEIPATVQWSATQASLGAACLHGSKDGRICLQGQWSEQGVSEWRAEAQQVSLEILRLFADTDWGFTQLLDGSLVWQQAAQEPARAEAKFRLSPGELLLEGESTEFRTGQGLFEFQITAGSLHSGKLVLPIPGSGEINADFSVERLLEDEAAGLQAALKLNLMDLAPLQLLVPQLDVVEGELMADIRVGGSLEEPKFTGHATLVRGRLEEQSLGLVLEDIKLAGSVYQFDHTEFNGSFRAGTGRGQIKAALGFADLLNPQLKMQISGENLLLINVPDLNLLAEPNLDVSWSPGNLQLNGRILIPSAELSPRYLPSSSAVESPDLVIISDQEEVTGSLQAVKPATVSSPLKITGQVEVELGDEVSLTLDRATINFRGKSNFIWSDGVIPIGDGRFKVSGKIFAYGQLLNITEGRVSFPRSPADNPSLNIKAEREIFGNSQIKTAGVRVTGTLRRPVLEPFTDPMTTREKALAMLITGSDFDYEQGVGAVEVGMYIAPKLFISYGIGLFEDQNVISARYDLGKGFGVKATSGQRETGVDISYTVDR